MKDEELSIKTSKLLEWNVFDFTVFGSQQQPQTGGSVFGGQASIGTGGGGGIFGQKRTATTFAGQLGTQGI